MASASKSQRIYAPASSTYGYILAISFNETGTSTANNTSDLSFSASLTSDRINFNTSTNHTMTIFWHDNKDNADVQIATTNVPSIALNGTVSLSGSKTVTHKSDGTLSGYAWVRWVKNSTNSYVPASTNVLTDNTALTTIPRKTTINNFGVSKRNETSFTFTWKTADTIDYAWYSTNNGSTWTGYDVTDGTSGSFVVRGLSANNSYNCKLRVRRKDSQLITESGNVPQTTYKEAATSLKSKTETSFVFNWSADSNLSKIEYRYKLSSASSYPSTWTNANIREATSGTLTISNLTANSNYNIQFRTTRSETTSETYILSTIQTQKTHQYPYVSGVGTSALTVGNSQTLTLENPLSRTVTVYMKQNNINGTTLYSGTTNGKSITFTPNANTLYASIPNSRSGNAVYYCTYSNQNVSTKSGTYVINNDNGQQNPSFSLSNWSYITNLTELTNNNQIVINNQSTITFNINTPAIAKNSATISSYKLEWGNANASITTNTGNVEKGNGNTLKVTAIDSRGNFTTTILNLGNNYINYFEPTYSEIITHRQDGIGTRTTLDLKGTIFNSKFGTSGVKNEFISAKYYVSSNNTDWSEDYGIQISSFVLNQNNYLLDDYEIHENGLSGGFTVGRRFYLKIELTDKLSKTTIYGTITDGKLATDVFQDSNGDYHLGDNGLASSQYTRQVNGTLNVTNGIYINGIDLETYINNLLN